MTKPECTCTPTLIRKHSLGSHGSLTPCDETCPVVDVRHSASCPLSVVRPDVLDSCSTEFAGFAQADSQASGRESIRDPEPSVSRFLGASRLPEQEAAYVVQDSVVMRQAQRMSHAVADLILRQSMALLDEGIGPKSYGSILGPDTGPQDVALILQAVDVIGQENILDRDLQDEIQSMRGEHG